MKKTILFSTLALTGAVFAADYTSSVAVGVQPVTLGAAKTTILAVPFDGATMENLVKAANLTAGDMLYKAKSGGYDAWKLVNTSGTLSWQSVGAVTVTKGSASTPDGTAAASASPANGDGIFLVRQTGTSGQVIYLQGNARSASSELTLAKGNNLVASPKTADLEFPVTGAVAGFTPTAGDQIVVPSDTGSSKSYTYNATKGWVNTVGIKKTETSVTIPAGTGFWYKSVSGGTMTFVAD